MVLFPSIIHSLTKTKLEPWSKRADTILGGTGYLSLSFSQYQTIISLIWLEFLICVQKKWQFCLLAPKLPDSNTSNFIQNYNLCPFLPIKVLLAFWIIFHSFQMKYQSSFFWMKFWNPGKVGGAAGNCDSLHLIVDNQ